MRAVNLLMATLSVLHVQCEEPNVGYIRCLYGQLLAPQTSFKSNLNAHYGFKQRRKLIELPSFNRIYTHSRTAISFRTHTPSHAHRYEGIQPSHSRNRYDTWTNTHKHSSGLEWAKGAWPLSLSYNNNSKGKVTSITLLISLGKSFAQMQIKEKNNTKTKREP